MARLFPGLLSDRLDPRWGRVELVTFHWGFYRVRERYEQALRSCAPTLAKPVDSVTDTGYAAQSRSRQ
jgi:hypothetical protein